MAVTFKGSQIYVNGVEPASGQLAGFTKNDIYTPLNSSDVNNSGFLTYTTTTDKPKAYIAGYSGNYYITKLTYHTSVPLESITLTLYCTGADNTSVSNKIHRGFIVSTNSSLASSYSSFGSNSDSSIVFTGNELKSTVTYDSDIIPAGLFYIYLGPGNQDTSGTKYSSIYAIQSTFKPLSFSSVNALTISYDPNGGSDTTESQFVKAGDTVTLQQNSFSEPIEKVWDLVLDGNGGADGTPTFKGNYFKEWRAGSTSGTAYAAGAFFTPSGDTTMYAWWGTKYLWGSTTRDKLETDGYKVTFNANGGSCSISSLTAKNTTEYTFLGWSKKKDDATVLFDSTSIYGQTDNYTAYAFWESVTANGSILLPTAEKVSALDLTINFDYQGGSGTPASANSVKTTTKAFEGWATSSSATSGITGSYTPDKDCTLYAVWGETTVKYNAIELPTPTRIGYEFMGWATSPTAISGVTGTYTPTSDDITTLYAIWGTDGNVRIYIDDTYKMAMVYIYTPADENDAKPWKLAIPYMKDGTGWKIIAG